MTPSTPFGHKQSGLGTENGAEISEFTSPKRFHSKVQRFGRLALAIQKKPDYVRLFFIRRSPV